MPGRGVNMGDGWETRRRREPGNDWCIVALAQPGVIQKIEVDTAHFKGNYPDRCSLQAAYVKGGTDSSLVTQAMFWPVLLGEQKLQMDKHAFLRVGTGGARARDARALQHLPGRRRIASASLRDTLA